MKMKKMRKHICLAVAALLLMSAVNIKGVLAYFTTFADTSGGVELDLGFTKTTITEEKGSGNQHKKITLTNNGNYECYVRLKTITGASYTNIIIDSEPVVDEVELVNWSEKQSDGYYYYGKKLAPGESTTQLYLGFDFTNLTQKDFNVIVIQECTPVLYDTDGNLTFNWAASADVSQVITEQ